MTKVISLTDEAYEKLVRLKNSDSFSKTILKLTESVKKKPLTYFAGKWVGGFAESEKIFSKISEKRRASKLRRVSF